MKLLTRTLFIGCLCTLTFSLATADEDGFVDIFNKKDLTGWKPSEQKEGVPCQFTVENGELVVHGKRAHLFSEKKYKNFHLKLEIKTLPGSNSGVYIHTNYEDSWPRTGYEVQVNCTHGDPVKNGSIYHIVKNYDPIAKENEWYTMDIIVKGKNVVTKVNGKNVVDYTEPPGVTGTEKLNPEEGGNIAIQAHDPKSEIHYRSIKIKELPDSKK
ncbi:MAG: DUF1080 domain-containing protein [Planctomycetales bacterium]